jgi:hypothetical protein
MTKAVEAKEKKFLGAVPNVFFLGLVSLLTDVSSEMIFTLVPLFLSNVLELAPYISLHVNLENAVPNELSDPTGKSFSVRR